MVTPLRSLHTKMQLKKILSYDVYGDTANSYEYVADLLAGRSDPQTKEPGGIDCGHLTVYTSPLRRATGCINTTTAKKLETLFALREIPFDIKKYCSESAFSLFKATAVRQAFIRAFMANDLLIPHQVLQQELELVLALKARPEEILVISHTFRIRCLEAYEQIGADLFKNPVRIGEFIQPENKIMDFGESVLLL